MFFSDNRQKLILNLTRTGLVLLAVIVSFPVVANDTNINIETPSSKLTRVHSEQSVFEDMSEEISSISKLSAGCSSKVAEKKSTSFLALKKILPLGALTPLLWSNGLCKVVEAYGYFQSTNLTSNVLDHLSFANYKMALGCPENQQEINNFLKNGRSGSWLPCRAQDDPEDCYSIRPIITSRYESFMRAGECYEGYNMGFAYVELQRLGKLKCKIERASEWMTLNLQRMHQLAKIYGHNIRILNSENELEFSRRMKRMFDEILDEIESPIDKKRINNSLYLGIRKKNQGQTLLSDGIYHPTVSLNVISDRLMRLAHAFKNGLIVTNLLLTSISDEEIIALSDAFKSSTSIKKIFMDCSKLTPIGASALAKMLLENRSLISLIFQDIPVTESVMLDFSNALSKNNVLYELELSLPYNTQPHDEVGVTVLAKGLSENKGLKILNLSSNQFSLEGVITLIEALNHNDHLKVLSLSSSKISDEGAFSIAMMLAKQFKERTFALVSNLISDRGALALLEALKKNVYIRISLESRLVSKPIRDQISNVMAWKNRSKESITDSQVAFDTV